MLVGLRAADRCCLAVHTLCLLYSRSSSAQVVPIWGQRLKRQLPRATYLELAPAGHCPHHEAPTAINNIIETWVAAVEAGEHAQHELLQVCVYAGAALVCWCMDCALCSLTLSASHATPCIFQRQLAAPNCAAKRQLTC